MCVPRPVNVYFRTVFLFVSKPFQPAHIVIDYCVLFGRVVAVGNPLSTLLELPLQERAERGLEHTPREIWQQPETWGTTYKICSSRRSDLQEALCRAGIGRGSA